MSGRVPDAAPAKGRHFERDESALWAKLRAVSPARIGLGRVGPALPLAAALELQAAHATARDAVHANLDAPALARALAPLETIEVASAAGDRSTYLRRPDLGRTLDPASAATLHQSKCDLAFVIGDGLSAAAVQAHAAALLNATLPLLGDLRIGPIIIARHARVAIGDPIGEALGARMSVVLIGERPGLTVADSLGVYLTYDPRPGRRDSERNCISNVHSNGGLTYEAAARTLSWLVQEGLQRRLTGVGLKVDGGRLSNAGAIEPTIS